LSLLNIAAAVSPIICNEALCLQYTFAVFNISLLFIDKKKKIVQQNLTEINVKHESNRARIECLFFKKIPHIRISAA